MFGFVRHRRGRNRGIRSGRVAGRGYGTGNVFLVGGRRRRPAIVIVWKDGRYFEAAWSVDYDLQPEEDHYRLETNTTENEEAVGESSFLWSTDSHGSRCLWEIRVN